MLMILRTEHFAVSFQCLGLIGLNLMQYGQLLINHPLYYHCKVAQEVAL